MNIHAEMITRKWPQCVASVRIRKRGLFGEKTKRRIYIGNANGWFDVRTRALAEGAIKVALDNLL